MTFPTLVCQGASSLPTVIFKGTGHGAVLVTVGDNSAIGTIRREEIAALAALFPIRPPRLHTEARIPTGRPLL